MANEIKKEYELIHGKKREFRTLNAQDTLAQIRGQLGSFMSQQDLFTYYDPRQKRQFPQLKSSESKYRLADVLDHRNKAAIIDPNSGVPDLQAHKVSSFSDRGLRVSIKLDRNTTRNRTANEGKMNPLMVEKVQTIRDAANPFPDLYWDHAVICQEGSVIQLDYSCPAASGVDVTHEAYSRSTGDSVDVPNFTVSSLEEIGIPDRHRLKYCYLKVTAWREKQFSPGDAPPIDIPVNNPVNNPGTGSAGAENGTKNDTLIIPGLSIKSAVPQPFTEMIPSSAAAGLTGFHWPHILGELNIYFLVCDSDDDARQWVGQRQ